MVNKKSINQKKICILSFANITGDTRVLREIEMARKHFQVTVIGFGAWEPFKNVKYVQVPKTKRSVRYLFLYVSKLILGRVCSKFYDASFWNKKEYKIALDFLTVNDFDLVHANDWDSLPVGAEAKQDSNFRLLFDAHEFSPEQEANKLLWRFLIKPYRIYLFNKFLQKADMVITVSSGIQNLYYQHFGIKSELILNATPYEQFHSSPTNEKKLSIIHHGNADRNRSIEEMIKMISLTDERFTLYLLLVERSDKNYVPFLKNCAKKNAPGRVVFLPPVDEEKVLDTVNKFDIGLPFLKASQKNILNALPNKFFHYIMTGLAIIVPPLPAMAEIIKREKIGCVAQSMDTRVVANMLNRLDGKKIDDYKKHSLDLAKRMNAKVEMDKLYSIYFGLLSKINIL